MTTTLTDKAAADAAGPRGYAAVLGRIRNGTGRAGRWLALAIIAGYVLIAALGPVLDPYDPVSSNLKDRLLAPGARTAAGGTAWLGTDGLGRDMVAQLIAGARTSMIVGLCAVLAAGVFGVVVGLASGYVRGAADAVIMRVIDVQLAFPPILLAIVIAGLFGHTLTNVVFALAVTRWIPFARVARASALSLRERDWVLAARVLGVPWWRIIGRHVLPFVLGPAVAITTIEFSLIIVSEAGLSFLGVGLPPSTASWGQTIASGQDHLNTAWWISTLPGVLLAVLVVAIGIVGDRITDPAGNRSRP
ncbi:ABC transporter permease subunit [Actinomadura sp. LD22]|uniref:ABC transporter permease subunit n=1 Tax=Actinomadura physcomitrii TaxID=2650748 RepID=A0A6I4MD29_9ACTN|nr:ABC transporter permease [Actinomadura physcomitrii]MWA03622.1 ABC transporter permease subunit [Actinomadura physcomitrii]